jgi:hypothetical protein
LQRRTVRPLGGEVECQRAIGIGREPGLIVQEEARILFDCRRDFPRLRLELLHPGIDVSLAVESNLGGLESLHAG